MRAGTRSFTGGLAALAVALTGSVVTAASASAGVSTTAPVIIDEVYGGGGSTSASAAYKRDFIELHNPGDEAVSIAGWSVQYGSQNGTSWQVTPLTGAIAAGGSVLVGGGGSTGGADLTVDVDGSLNLSGSNGKVALVNTATALACGADCDGASAVVDFVGYGAPNDYAGTGPAPTMSVSTSVARTGHVNTASNAADFTAGTPTPLGGGLVAPEEPVDPEEPVTIAEIQGTGGASPLVGTTVTTTGVVTAAYPTGGRSGYVIQTAGTGGPLGTRTGSDAVFVYSPATVASVETDDVVQVTGAVSERFGQTQLTVAATADLKVLDEPGTVEPLTGTWPATAAAREAIESMLFLPTGDVTVSNTYSTNQYGEVGLATGTQPLLQWTEVADAQDAAAIQAVKDDNAARGVVLDDGATTNFLSAANQGLEPSYVSLTEPVRVGAAVTFDEPVVVSYLNDTWKLDPTAPVSGTAGSPASFENTRTPAPEAVGGDVTVASFNVLNYFTTLGTATASCVAYKDRAGDGVTVDEGCNQRGAWDAQDLQRQQDKIVAAINALDADVVGLLEIENSLKVDGVPDEALATLVGALNAAAGETRWAYVPSSGELPVVGEQDVITNAIIYQPAAVERRGPSRALGTLSTGNEPFGNAREPIAQAFEPVAGGEPLLVVVNHFKSKGSAGPLPGDADTGDGQGASNASRVAQATALRDWVPTIQGGVESVALVGDFNSYTQEDPLQVLYAAGYADATEELAPGEYSYSFSGLAGSLDHVLLNEAALDRATGADVWEINSPESIALEYSRYNYHGALYYAPDAYRSSDHDPVVVGLAAGADAPDTVDLTFLNINDFHGRIDANTVKFAGTVEQQRAAASGPVAFLSAGDNIGASLFASATQDDQPTIDVLNALDLAASAVGNHEFDKGFADLTDRVIGAEGDENAAWDYLGANVYAKGTENPVLPEYATFDMDGVTVAVIGAVTQETPSLVTPAGIADLDFGDPVEAVNRVAAQLTDGDAGNGEADVIVAEYHEGAGAGTPDGATLEEEVAGGGAFAEIVEDTSAAVDVIFTGHTHKQYAWAAPVPGEAGTTRPVLQTGSYGEFIGKVVLTYDVAAGEVVAHTEQNVARTTTADADLVAQFDRVAEVKSIVDEALAYATEVGSRPVGSITADITTAFTGGSYVGGKYVGSAPGTTTGRDDRASESTLGNLVANSLRETLADDARGGADIGVVNPGGLRGELLYARSGAETADGVVTYAEANAVLPFVNNLWTTTLTGAQVVTMLEQQWQTNPDGSVPSRPYLQLGLSDNVSYTYDPAAPRGEHITSVTVDGEPLDLEADYRIGTFSFLATGGDNFRVFTEGADARDSGLIDRDAWIAYLQSHDDLAPDFARHAVAVTDQPSEVFAGDAVTFGVSRLDLTSLGSPANTSLDIQLDGESIGGSTVTAGAATVAVVVPGDVEPGDHELTLVAAPSGTTVPIPLTVKATMPTATELTLMGERVVGSTQLLTARVDTAGVAGTVTFLDGALWLDTVPVRFGTASTSVQLSAGTHQLRAVFQPTEGQWGASTGTLAVTIARSSSTTAVTVSPATVRYGAAATARVTVTGASASPSGTVQLREGGKVVATGTLVGTGKVARATITLPRTLTVGTHALTATFTGSSQVAGSSGSATLRVVKAAPRVTLSAASWTVKKQSRPTVTVRVTGAEGAPAPTGKVTLAVGSTTLTGTLSNGKVSFTLPKMTSSVTVKATYAGSAGYTSASSSKRLVVR